VKVERKLMMTSALGTNAIHRNHNFFCTGRNPTLSYKGFALSGTVAPFLVHSVQNIMDNWGFKNI
jgi:hypothetical protein